MFVTNDFGDSDSETGNKEKSLKILFLYFFSGLISVLFTVFIFLSSNEEKPQSADNKAENIRLKRLKEKSFSVFTEDEKRDYCNLTKKLEKTILVECFCKCDDEYLEGSVNWFNPPEPDSLGSEWKELQKHEKDTSNSRYFQSVKNYNIIRYDESHGKKTGKHYHRYNKNIKTFKDLRKFKKENEYLDICGNVISNNIDEKNHIIIEDFKIINNCK